MQSTRAILASLAAATISVTGLFSQPISGTIGMAGVFSVNNSLGSATAITSFNPFLVSGSGDFTGASTGNTSVFGFTFAPFAPSPTWWSLALGADIFTFNLTSLAVTTQNANQLVMHGAGVARRNGADETAGSWSFSGDSFGTFFTFSAGASVPDGGTTAAMLGLGLIGLGVVSRRVRRAVV